MSHFEARCPLTRVRPNLYSEEPSFQSAYLHFKFPVSFRRVEEHVYVQQRGKKREQKAAQVVDVILQVS